MQAFWGGAKREFCDSDGIAYIHSSSQFELIAQVETHSPNSGGPVQSNSLLSVFVGPLICHVVHAFSSAGAVNGQVQACTKFISGEERR